MKKIISTYRGSLYIIKNLHEVNNLQDQTNFLFFDWPYTCGLISVPEINEKVILDGFNWSILNNYIEEDATVHSALAIYGHYEGKDIKTSILFPTNFPVLIEIRKKNLQNFDNFDFKQIFKNEITPYSFPCSDKYINGVYPIVDSLDLLHKMFDLGANMIQIRLKHDTSKNIQDNLIKAINLSLSYPSSKLFINDYWKIAIENKAFGVHLGQEDLLKADMQMILSSKIHLGVSTHSYWEVSRAIRYRPSYIACGPIYQTRVKKMPWIPQGVRNLKYWTRVIDLPVVGIGGINLSNIKMVKNTNCSGVAVINAVSNSKDPYKSFNDLNSLWNMP